jgi:ABC-type glutathione transport system ATPase component
MLQNYPDSRDLILLIGDIFCIIPQMAFQRGLGAVLEVSAVFKDERLSWTDVWAFETRVWLPMLLMIFAGTLEWTFLYRLTTSREARTVLKDDEVWNSKPSISGDPDISEERSRSLKDNQGINARDLVKVFKTKPDKNGGGNDTVIKRAVKGVSFGIRENEIYALLGPNGSGKTVTMSMLASKYTPCNGEIVLDGSHATGDVKHIDHLYSDCNVAYCPQFDSLFPLNSVEEHMEFYATVRGLDWNEQATQDHINAIVKLLGLRKHLEKGSAELSGGYKRRLSLAIALIGYPNVLIIDEVSYE